MIYNDELIPELLRKSREISRQINEFFAENEEVKLRQRPTPETWNVLDCIAHLNRTYDWYLPQLKKSFLQISSAKAKLSYRPGYFGQKMTEGSQPTQGKIRFRMKTFKKFEPHTDDQKAEQVLQTYLENQRQFEQYLEQAKNIHLGKIRVTSAVGPILRFKLGDCFRFLIAHEERHLLQAQRILEEVRADRLSNAAG